MIKKSHLPLLLALLASIFFAYWGLWDSYFEQDEWHSFGNYNFLFSLKGLEFFTNLMISDFPYHFAPLSLIFKMNLYKVFALNAVPYFIISLVIHFLVSVSVYLLVLLLFKKKLAAFLGALFFALNSSHYQAVTWIGTFEGVEFSVLFGSLSLSSYLIYLRRKKIKFLLITFILLFTSLLFKETALTFLLILGLLIIFKKKDKLKVWGVASLGLISILYILFRFAYLLFGMKIDSIPSMGARGDFGIILAYNFLTSFVKVFAQIFFPNELLVLMSNITTLSLNSYSYFAGPWFAENGFRYDLLTISLGFLILALIIGIHLKCKERQPVLLGLGIILLTLFPLLALGRYLTYLDSRYLYPATLGFSLIIALLSKLLMSFKKRLVIGIGLLALFVLLSLHIFSLKETINKLIKTGQRRQSIISLITSTYPQLPPKIIFYTNSNSSFYGTAEGERIMPFQSGFGQLLLTVYYPTERFPRDFFKDEFLWNLTDQGYQEFGGRGFGYFRDFDLIGETLKSKKLLKEAVFSFSYDSKNNNLVDTTEEIRQHLIGFMANKEEVGINEIITDANREDIYFAFDKNTNTFWDSGLPISFSQNIILDLEDVFKVVSININSQSSNDQNRNGYQVLVSEDRQSWQEVFYEKLYSPKAGLVNIYFAPQKARFLNVKQVGDHQYASWVINEIKVYRAIN